MSETYTSPFAERYSSPEMLRLFSSDHKFRTWRRLWVALAESERALGLAIAPAQIREMKQHVDDINYDVARQYEERLKHDVMAHVRAFGDQCPKARPIIHLGATSCFVTDNGDLLAFRRAFELLAQRLAAALRALGAFARTWRAQPCLGYTHFQVAQPVTVGKRACLWAQDFALDLDEVRRLVAWLPFRGAKGTTGTQASFLTLAHGVLWVAVDYIPKHL